MRGVLTVPVAATTVGDARGNGGHEGVPDGHLPHAGRVLTRAAHLGGSDIIKVGPRRSHGDALTGHFIGDTEDTESSGRFFVGFFRAFPKTHFQHFENLAPKPL